MSLLERILLVVMLLPTALLFLSLILLPFNIDLMDIVIFLKESFKYVFRNFINKDIKTVWSHVYKIVEDKYYDGFIEFVFTEKKGITTIRIFSFGDAHSFLLNSELNKNLISDKRRKSIFEGDSPVFESIYKFTKNEILKMSVSTNIPEPQKFGIYRTGLDNSCKKIKYLQNIDEYFSFINIYLQIKKYTSHVKFLQNKYTPIFYLECEFRDITEIIKRLKVIKQIEEVKYFKTGNDIKVAIMFDNKCIKLFEKSKFNFEGRYLHPHEIAIPEDIDANIEQNTNCPLKTHEKSKKVSEILEGAYKDVVSFISSNNLSNISYIGIGIKEIRELINQYEELGKINKEQEAQILNTIIKFKNTCENERCQIEKQKANKINADILGIDNFLDIKSVAKTN